MRKYATGGIVDFIDDSTIMKNVKNRKSKNKGKLTNEDLDNTIDDLFSAVEGPMSALGFIPSPFKMVLAGSNTAVDIRQAIRSAQKRDINSSIYNSSTAVGDIARIVGLTNKLPKVADKILDLYGQGAGVLDISNWLGINSHPAIAKNNNTMRKKYAFGGQTNSTINAEGGEILQTPQGQVGNINGATHANGGVNLNVPNGSLIFSDRIGIKDNKGKFSSLADRKRIRENTLARLGKRQRDPFQINTIARTGQKLDQEEQADVALQTMVRNAIEGRGNLNSNVDSNEVPKAAWGTGDYINTGMNILGSFMNKSNVEKSIASTSQPMPNFNKNYGTAGLEKLRGASEDLKTQGTYAQNIINSQLQQDKQDIAAGIDNMGGSINLRRALRSKSANDVNQVYGDTMTKLNSEVLGAQTQLAGQEATMLNARDVALAGGEKAKFEYDTALARSNAGASNAASNELIGSIGGIGKSISESALQDRQTELMNNMLMIQGEGKFGFTNSKFGPINNTIGANNTVGLYDNWDSSKFGPKPEGTFALGGEVGGKSNPLLDMLSSIKREPITFTNQTTTPEPDLNTGFVNELGGTNAKIKEQYTTERNFAAPIMASGNDIIDKIMRTIRGVESGGNYTTPNKAGASSATGAYQFTRGTWKGLTKKYGVGSEYDSAGTAPKHVQDIIAHNYIGDLLKKAGGDVSKIPLAWYTGNLQGKISDKALAANRGLLPSTYQSRWLKRYNRS